MKKILSLLALVLMSCMGAWADGITSLDQLSNDKVYNIRTAQNVRGSLYYDSNYSTYLSATGTFWHNGTDIFSSNDQNCQFAILKSPKDNYYLYSVGAGKFVYSDGTHARLSDAGPETTINFVNANSSVKATHPWVIGLKHDGNGKVDNLDYIGMTNWAYYNSQSDKAPVGAITYDHNANDAGTNVAIVEAADFDATLKANALQAIDLYENPPYAIGFANTTHTNSGRQITSIKLGDQEIRINGAGNVYQDLTETESFTINVGEDVKPAIIWNGAWMHGYVYVDTDASDKQFTVEELVSSAPMPNPERNVNLATEFNTFHIDNAGDYRMRYKVEWNHTDPLGNGGALIANGGYVLDVMLHVVEPEETLTFNYTSTSGATWSVQKYVEANHSVVESDYAVDFYNNYQISGGENNIYTVKCDDNFPFTAGVATRIQSRGSGHQNQDFYNGVTYPLYGATGFDPNTNLWVFEHVANSADLFTVKNVATGKYLTFQSGTRQIGSLVETASNSGNNTSQMRVRKSTYASAPEGAFCLQHPTVVACCYGPHINDTGYGDPVNNGLGGWAAGNEEAALSNNQNCLIAIAPDACPVKLSNPNPGKTNGLNGKYVGTFSAVYNVQLPESVIAYKAAIDGTTVNFTMIGSYVPANTGVLLYAESAQANIDAQATPCANSAISSVNTEANAFHPTTGGDIPEGSYILANKNDHVSFYLIGTNRTVAKNKAYLTVPSGSNLSAFRFDFEDTLTGIEAVETENSNVIYDLQGRRVQNAKSGLYIVNGKKVIR